MEGKIREAIQTRDQDLQRIRDQMSDFRKAHDDAIAQRIQAKTYECLFIAAQRTREGHKIDENTKGPLHVVPNVLERYTCTFTFSTSFC